MSGNDYPGLHLSLFLDVRGKLLGTSGPPVPELEALGLLHLRLILAHSTFGYSDDIEGLAGVETALHHLHDGIRIIRYLREQDDIRTARVFDDWAVTKASFNFDIHNIDGSGLDENGEQKKFTQKKGYTIPYGCLVPKEIDGLLLAGRNISGTHKAHSNFRVMPICANIGQAAGTAAALCAAQDIQPRDLSVSLLQEKLQEQGVGL